MLKNADMEVDYRLCKWIFRNLEKEQLLTQDEVKELWQELLDIYDPPTRSLETVTGAFRGGENG